MPEPLSQRLGLIEAALAEAAARPLSARKALLVAALLDDFCDRAFYALHRSAPDRVHFSDDVLAFRARLRAGCPGLGLVQDLCALRPDGPRLVVETVAVPIADYGRLSVEDFMVSLYNGNTVQRLMITGAPGGARPALEVLTEALAALRDFGE